MKRLVLLLQRVLGDAQLQLLAPPLQPPILPPAERPSLGREVGVSGPSAQETGFTPAAVLA